MEDSDGEPENITFSEATTSPSDDGADEVFPNCHYSCWGSRDDGSQTYSFTVTPDIIGEGTITLAIAGGAFVGWKYKY